jgi:transposase InsO family protein
LYKIDDATMSSGATMSHNNNNTHNQQQHGQGYYREVHPLPDSDCGEWNNTRRQLEPKIIREQQKRDEVHESYLCVYRYFKETSEQQDEQADDEAPPLDALLDETDADAPLDVFLDDEDGMIGYDDAGPSDTIKRDNVQPRIMNGIVQNPVDVIYDHAEKAVAPSQGSGIASRKTGPQRRLDNVDPNDPHIHVVGGVKRRRTVTYNPIDHHDKTPEEAAQDLQVEIERRAEYGRCHNNEVGHYGVRETCWRIQQNGQAWPRMEEQVKQWNRACWICQLASPQHEFGTGTELSDLAETEIGEVLHGDTLGPYSPRAGTLERYLLVFIDAFTRLVTMIPILDTSTASAVGGLRWYLWRHPCPRRIHTDAGSQFNSVAWREYLAQRGIEGSTGIPYAHRTSGLVERANQEIRRHTRMQQLNSESCIWDFYLKIQDMLNNHRNTTTKFTPNNLMFGSFVKSPLPLVNRDGYQMSLSEYQNMMELDHPGELKQARANQKRAIEIRKRLYEQEHRAARDYGEYTAYEEGQLVLAEFADHMKPSKGGPICDGPLRVKEILSSNTCVCEHLTTTVERDYSFSQLLPFFTNRYEPTPWYVAARSRACWVIEAVRKHRYNRDRELEVYVKWENFPEAANTWELCKNNRNNTIILLYCGQRTLPFTKPQLKPYRRA